MKKVVLSILLLMTVISVQSQSLDKTRWGDWDIDETEQASQENKPDDIIGHSPILSTADISNNLIAKALESSVFIIKQQYRLEKDGMWWGSDNKDFFGEVQSLGIKVSGGLMFTGTVVEPWLFDSKFDEVDRDYKPFVYDSYVKSFGNNQFEKLNLELGSSYTRTVVVQPKDDITALKVYYHDEAKVSFGLPLIEQLDSQEIHQGYLALVYYDEHSPIIEVSNFTLNKSDEISTKLVVSNPGSLIGGFMVTTAFQQGGRIQLQLAGIAVQDPDAKDWTLLSLSK